MSDPTVNDVLSQIEFELAQGLVARPDLRRAILELQSLQNGSRATILGSGRPIDLRDALSRQLQINDLLIAVLAEAADAAGEARDQTRHVQRFLHSALDSEDAATLAADEAAPADPAAIAPRDAASRAEEATADREAALRLVATPAPRPVRPLHDVDDLSDLSDDDRGQYEIERAMHPENLWLAMDSRPPRLPLVGGLFRRFRVALHTRVLIYTGQLGDKQAAVNRIFGDHLLRLRAIVRVQQDALDRLRLRLRRLESSARRGGPDRKG